MRSVFQLLLPALLWAVVFWRAPAAFRTASSRPLWATIMALAIAETTRLAPADRFLQICTGIPDISLLVKHLTGLAVVFFMLEYLSAIHGGRRAGGVDSRPRYVAAMVSALVMILLFAFFLPHDGGQYDIDAHYGDPQVRLYLGVFYGLLGWSTASAARVFWSNRIHMPRGFFRIGTWCLAAGSTMGFVYSAYRVYFVFSRGNTSVPIYDPLSEFLPVIAVMLLLLGVSIPPTLSFFRYLRDQYAMWRLHSLWSRLVQAVPNVVFGTPRSRVRDLFVVGDRTLDVAHRAFEIRDAILVLRAEAPAGTLDDAYHAAGENDRVRARAHAEWLHAAIGSRLAGQAIPVPPADVDSAEGGRRPREEIDWLLKVAAAYGSSGGRS